MATNSINLSDIRKPGVTTIEVDTTQQELNFNVPLREERIVIGFSRKGPFNKVVRIFSIAERQRIFGNVDTFLEKRGSFFHRFIDISLQEGPVLALNLLPLNNDSSTGDKVDFASFSVSPLSTNPEKIKELYSAFFAKERFWNPSEDNLISIVDSNVTTKDSIISMVNLGQSPLSILIKKSEPPREFNVYAQEYYGGIENVPFYINPLDKVSEYFVDVKVVKGDFTNYQNLSTDPIYGKYFTPNGLKSTSVDSLEGSSDFEVLLSLTGSILPDLVDGSGISYSIDTLINAYQVQTGLFTTINSDYLNSLTEEDTSVIDLIGHSLVDENEEIEEVNFLSYKFKLLENLIYVQKSSFTTDSVPLSSNVHYQNSVGVGDNGLFSNRLILDGVEVQENIIPKTSLIKLNNTSKFGVITNYSTSSGNTIISYKHPDKSNEGKVSYIITEIDSANSNITIKGIHSDFGLGMAGEYIFLTDNISKYYFEIDSYEIDTPNNTTNVTVIDTSSNLENLNLNYKASWSGTIEILSVDQTNNKITIDGEWDMTTISANLSSNRIYIKSNDEKTGNLTFSTHTIDSGNSKTTLTLTSANIKVANGTVYNLYGLEQLSNLTVDSNYVTFGVDSITRPYVNTDNVDLVYTPDVIKIEENKLIAYKSSQVYKDWDSGVFVQGDSYFKEITGPSVKEYFIGIEKLLDNDGIEYLVIDNYTDTALTTKDSEYIVFGNKKRLDDDVYESVGGTEVAFSSKIGNINSLVQINSTFDNGTRIRLTSTEADKIIVGDFINTQMEVNGVTKNYLSPVLTKKRVTISSTLYYEITLPRSVKIIQASGNYYIERYEKIDSFAQTFNLISLSGFTLNSYHLPGDFLNRDSQLEKILNVIDDTNLGDSLKDRNLIDFRYIIDTFESPVTNELYPKTILANLAKNQSKSFAILNGPSIEAFSKSSLPGPIFSEATNNRVFEAKFIETGGNRDLSPDYFYSNPSELNGAKYSTTVGPYFIYRLSNGKRIKIPVSAHVGNLFVRKNRFGDMFKPAAGTSRGFVRDPQVVGVEYISENDIVYFTQVGYNPFIDKPGYGIIFYGNKTNYLKNSTLSNLHVRDMLSTVERLIENVLERYIFENNTPRTRYAIFEDLTSLLYPLRGEAFFDFSVKIDDENNNGAILDGSFGIVEIDIYPLSYIEKFINVLNIKKGIGIETSGFQI